MRVLPGLADTGTERPGLFLHSGLNLAKLNKGLEEKLGKPMRQMHSSNDGQGTMFAPVQEPEQRTVTKVKFAEILGVSKGRVSQLVKDGLPVEATGRIDIEQGKAWYAKNCSPSRRKALTDRQTMTPKGELEVIKAERARLDLEREKGNLIDRFAAERVIFERARGERDAWIGWASRASILIASELEIDPADTFSILDRLVRDHLADLADLPVKELSND